MAILLNDAELFAMRGLPHAAVCLYLAIRQAMDMATGMVGVKSMISWQGLRESLYIEPAPGRTESGSMHESKLRRLADLLEKAGLVKNSSNSSNRQLIFKCLLATHDKSAQNKPDRHPDRPKQPAKPATARVYQFEQPEPDRHPDTHPSFSSQIYNLSSSSTVDQLEKSPDDDDAEIQIQTPLIYPPRTEDWHGRMQTMLRNIPRDDAQMLLDELAGQLRTGRVSKPLGYLAKMLENYLRGDFRGELAAGEKAIRDRRQKEAEQRAAQAEKPVYRKNIEAAQAALATIKAMQSKGAKA